MLDIARSLSASASVHALTGSSQPGAVPPLVPLFTARNASTAAPHASRHPDAEVIDLAERVKALARRDHRIWDRRATIEDTVDAGLPALPMRPEAPSRETVREVEVDGMRITTITTPLEPDPAYVAALTAHEAALAERNHLEAEMEAKLGYPRWEKLSKRTFARLVRWTGRLAFLQPRTGDGLKAKAEVQSVLAATGNSGRWTTEFAAVVGRDAVRMATSDAEASRGAASDPFVGYHAEVLGLKAVIAATDERSPEQVAAWDRWKEIDSLFLASRPTTLAGAIGALELARREHHQFSIEDCSDDSIGTDDQLIQHALTSALDVLRPLVQTAAPAMANVQPAPLPVGNPAGLYPAGTSREDVETYRTFLDRELRYLNWEIYGETEGRLHLWLDNPAARLHGPSQPPASSRATAVLALLGIMPIPGVDGRAQAEGLARAASAA